MLALDDFIHIGLLSAVDLTAVLVNSLFIFIIIKKTPKDLTNYAVLLINIACVDLLSSLFNFLCIVRVVLDDGQIYFVYIGPCTLVNAQLCHICLAGSVTSIYQSNQLMLLSFTYRLWMLKPKQISLQSISKVLWTATGVLHLFASLIWYALYWSGSYPAAKNASNPIVSTIDISGGIRDNLLQRITVTSLVSGVTFGFGLIFFIRKGLFAGIKNLRQADRHSHQMIFRSLTAQMLLPLAYVVGCVFFLIDMLGIVHSETMQRCNFAVTSIFSLGSPLINMYYIPAYRKYLKSVFSKDVRITRITSTSGVTSPHHSRNS